MELTSATAVAVVADARGTFTSSGDLHRCHKNVNAFHILFLLELQRGTEADSLVNSHRLLPFQPHIVALV